jgi:hypothetical protein
MPKMTSSSASNETSGAFSTRAQITDKHAGNGQLDQAQQAPARPMS